MSNPLGNWDVAPHGIIMFAALAVILVIVIHMLGFRLVGAIKVGQ